MREYDLIAEWYAANRTCEIGVAELDAIVTSLPVSARVLDLGCGNGIPLATALLARGYAVYGIDSSAEMIARFRVNCPTAVARHADIVTTDFFGVRFDAIVAWGVLFHLAAPAQERVLAKCAAALSPGGRLLFTSGREAGTRDGEMNGVPFHYVSLGSARYREVLASHGLRVVDEHADAGDNYVYIAQATP